MLSCIDVLGRVGCEGVRMWLSSRRWKLVHENVWTTRLPQGKKISSRILDITRGYVKQQEELLPSFPYEYMLGTG